MTMTVKIPADAHAQLADIAAERETAMGQVCADLIEQERRRRFFEQANAAYARLKADPEGWADWQDELRSREGTLMDGQEGDPWEE